MKKLGWRDSNPQRQNQNLQCYHYTTSQNTAMNHKTWIHSAKAIIQKIRFLCQYPHKKISNMRKTATVSMKDGTLTKS